MKYQVGDKILLLHSKEEGLIVEILDKEMLLVEVQGVQFPVFTDQVDFPYYYQFSSLHKKAKIPATPTQKNNATVLRVEKSVKKNEEGMIGLQLIVFPVYAIGTDEEDVVVDRLKLYLHNGLSKKIEFSYQGSLLRQLEWQINATLEGGDDFYLHDILLEQFNDSPSFQFNFLDTSSGYQLQETIRIKPKLLFDQLQQLKLTQKASFAILITADLAEKEQFPINTDTLVAPTNSSLKPPSLSTRFEDSFDHVIDLHIDKLIANYKGLSNFEILSIQMKAFEKKVEIALLHHQVSLTVIHGVGKGKLKDEIHLWLKGKPFVKQFTNQYDPFYGHGATTIDFQY